MTFGEWAEEHGGSIRYFVVALVWALLLPAAGLTGLIFLLFCLSPAVVVAAPLLIILLFCVGMPFRWYLRKLKDDADWRIPENCLTRYLPWYLPAIYYGLVLTAAFFMAAETARLDISLTVLKCMPHFFVWMLGLGLVQTYMEGPDAVFATLWSAITLSLVLAGCMTVYFRKISQPAKKRVRGVAVIAGALACVTVAASVAYVDFRSQVLPESGGKVAVVRESPKIRRGPWEMDDFSPYEPFSAGNRLVKIESPGLKIAADHPKIYAAISFYPLAAAVEAIYENVGEKQVREEKLLVGGTSPQTFDALLEGGADIAFMFRPSEEQMAEAEKAGKTLVVTPIGRDAFVFFVSMANPVAGLSATEIRDIYAKKITRWDAVGGNREKILAFQRPEGSGSQTAMERFMGEMPLPPPVQEEFQVSMRGIVNRVADYRNYGNSLGYSFRFYVQGMSADAGVKLLAVDGVAPTVEHIRSGAYPLVEEVVIVTAGSENPHVQSLVDWFLSAKGQELVEKVGYVGVMKSEGE